MAVEIVESCVNCWACAPLCPNNAIVAAQPHFLVDDEKCTECLGDFAAPQCVAICPIEGAIVNEWNEAMNPPGSLTGIPPARWAAVQAEIAAR
ncbi:MAG: 4Fe-4S binding protein [Rhodocyclaceae bacterium]|nr:4Fe-4S binding protein [Rhodocyclaceae bacterium]